MYSFTLKTALLLAFITINALTLNAQRLPGIQQKPVAIPANAKIDGTITEWNNQLQAHNTSTDIYYTLANDKQNIYLAVQATDPEIIKKIMRGGVTLTICTSGQRNDPNPLIITFPALTADYQSGSSMLLNNLVAAQKNKGKIDSAQNAFNRLIASKKKQLKVKGFKTITDSLVLLHNDFGLMAASLVDDKAVFTSELMIPLALIGPIAGKEIAYHITLSGETAVVSKAAVSAVEVFSTADPKTPPVNQSLFYPTDFWGKYTLTD